MCNSDSGHMLKPAGIFFFSVRFTSKFLRQKVTSFAGKLSLNAGTCAVAKVNEGLALSLPLDGIL